MITPISTEDLEIPECTCGAGSKHKELRYHEKTCAIWMYTHLYYTLQERETNLVVRQQTTDEEMQQVVLDEVLPAIGRRLARHGYGLAAGPHEIYGILAEEMDELIDELRDNNHTEFYHELLDIAVGAIFGMASMKNRYKHE